MPDTLQMLSHLFLKWLDKVGDIINMHVVQMLELAMLMHHVSPGGSGSQTHLFPHFTERLAK